MNEDDRPQIDLLQTWLKGGHESLSDEERVALDQLIVDSPKAREALVMLGQQEAWLMWHGSRTASAGELAAQQDLSEERRAKDLSLAGLISEPLIAAIESGAGPAPAGQTPIAFSRWLTGMGHSAGRSLLTFALGVLVAICLVQGWWIYRGIDSTAAQPNVNVAAKPVAYLAVENGCSWRDASSLRGIGSGVRPGDEIALQEGIAEFRLTSGVYLSVEGPAALVVTSPSSLILQYGKLTVNVPWTVTDFKAIASQCRLSACDAEFGVSLSPGNAEVHVFSGEVQAVSTSWVGERHGLEEQASVEELAHPMSEPQDAFLTEAVIAQGRSLVLKGDDGDLKIAAWGAADETRFATRLPMAWPLPVTQTYIDAVLHSQPLAYWRFETTQAGRVKSEVTTGCDLKVIGNLRLAGNAENHMAEFGQPDIDSLLVSNRPLNELANTEYSVEVWVKSSHLHCGSVLSLVADVEGPFREAHALYLELQGARGRSGSPFTEQYPGRIRFLHRAPPSWDPRMGSSCFSEQPYRVRRWHHVVAVKSETEMTLYVDGQLTSRVPEKTLLVTDLRLVVGQHAVAIRKFPFVGQLDELAIYGRALSPAEIERHYGSINWSPDRKPESKPRNFISLLPKFLNIAPFRSPVSNEEIEL